MVPRATSPASSTRARRCSASCPIPSASPIPPSAAPTARPSSIPLRRRSRERSRARARPARRARDHPRDRRPARAHGRGVQGRARLPRARAQPDRARHLLGDVERALLLQVLQGVAQEAAHHRPAGDLRARRECRRRRYRRRPGRHLQDGEPQPPLLHRALSGCCDGGRRHPARRLHHGGAARRQSQRPPLRQPGPSQDPPSRRRRRRRHRRLRQLRRHPAVGRGGNFHSAYNGNILVNAMTVGIARADRIFYSAAAGIGHPIVYVGSKTGRDGIHGATMASAEFDERSEEKRPTVQVGDPFTEKLLLEACLELMATDAIEAIQDMGAAGLTSSSVEMASKGGTGVELDLDRVPLRESGMTPYEIMLSESQERMLMVLKPGREALARQVFEKWALDFAVIGRLTDTGRLVLRRHGEIACDIPLAPLVNRAPVYSRPYAMPKPRPELAAAAVPAPADARRALLQLLASPDLCSRRWIWEQYDHTVMADTVIRPGGDAAMVRVHGTRKALALTTDCTPRYCAADPVRGGAQAVAEAYRNITATGATPLAV